VVDCHWYLTVRHSLILMICAQMLYGIQILILFLIKQVVQIHYYHKIYSIGRVLKVHKVKWDYYRNLIPKEVYEQEYWRTSGEFISGFSSSEELSCEWYESQNWSCFSFFFLCCQTAQSHICGLPLPSTQHLRGTCFFSRPHPWLHLMIPGHVFPPHGFPHLKTIL